MPVETSMQSLTAVAASNSPAGTDNIANNLDNYLRSHAAILRHTEARGTTLTATPTMAIAAATGAFVHVDTGGASLGAAVSIGLLGTVDAGIRRTLVFNGIAKLLHSANLLLPGSATYVTAAGDVAQVISEGAGVWRMTALAPNSGEPVSPDLTTLRVAAFSGEYDNGASGAAKTVDWNNGNKQKLTLSASCTITFTDPPGPTSGLVLKVIQAAAGAYTLTWPANVYWPNSSTPTQSSAANRHDLWQFYWDGTNYYGTAIQNFAV